MKVSIIIPVYNVAPYIERCLASVFQQTYDNIEVIIVDDCATDNSMEVVNKFVASYSGGFTVRIISHAGNQGLSAARNTGIRSAGGEYLYLLDSDDAITADCISLLTSPLAEYPDLDLVIGNYKLITADKSSYLMSSKRGYLSGNDTLFRSFLKREWHCMACNKLINRKLIIDNDLFFKEGIFHEDVLWTFFLASIVSTMYAVEELTYLYYIRTTSIMGCFSERNLDDYQIIVSELSEWTVSKGLQGDSDIYRYIETLKAVTFTKRAGIKCSSSLYPTYLKYRECRMSPENGGFRNRFKFSFWEFHYGLPAWLGYRYILLISYMYNWSCRLQK